MTYDVVVVGAGLGGLAAAALLAARGQSVCVVERAPRAGGCAASFEHLGYTFEPGAGLYACWQPGELHERIFAELPVEPPEVRPESPAYAVRLPDDADVLLPAGDEATADALRASFPECANAAVRFYRDATQVAAALHRAARRTPHLATSSRVERLQLLASEPRAAARILSSMNDTTARHLHGTSARFRHFIDAQLLTFGLCHADECAYLFAALALAQPARGLYSIRGGAQALADRLVASVEASGGRVRFNSAALRLDFGADGGGNVARGVELLSGEHVGARRAVVSNLTMWDTYAKLVGAARTPAALRARLAQARGRGAYLLFLSLDEDAAARLPCERVLVGGKARPGESGEASIHDDEDGYQSPFMFAAAPAWDVRPPAGKRAVTVCAPAEVEPWFAFRASADEDEARDQKMLEDLWRRLHRALPELGDSVEVVETANPLTFYETTRRRFGTVGGFAQSPDFFGARAFTHRTPVPNLYLAGDNVFPGQGVAAVTLSGLIVANEIAPPPAR